MSETHDRLMGEVDYVSVRQELLQLNRKFTGYWMRTSEGCSEMTDLIQNVKDDSQQIHAALANELEQVTDRMHQLLPRSSRWSTKWTGSRSSLTR